MSRDKDYIVTNDGAVYKSASDEMKLKGLPSGCYKTTYDSRQGSHKLEYFTPMSDSLVDLPDGKYHTLLSELKTFFSDEAKLKFKKLGFLYKKSILLHGKPGTGKTCIINKIMTNFLTNQPSGLVLFNAHPQTITDVSNVTPKDVPMLVVYEEIDGMIDRYFAESQLLNVLDGDSQRPNTFFLMTTNYIGQLPKRLLRPGRMSNVIDLGTPSAAARKFFIEHKAPGLSPTVVTDMTTATKGFTIDEIKHVLLGHVCLGYSLKHTIADIKERSAVISKCKEVYATSDDDYNDDEDDNDGIRF